MLQDELTAFRNKVMAQMPPEVAAVMAAAQEKLAATGIVNRALAAGDPLPAFRLPDVHGVVVDSADLLARGPLVVSFYRGGW